jgi:hypothetical protein
MELDGRNLKVEQVGMWPGRMDDLKMTQECRNDGGMLTQ